MFEIYLPLIEAMLKEAVADTRIPKTLRESMAYSLLSGGKRLRPSICLTCCALVGGAVEQALPLACGVEMIHAYSLVHDDLPCMDNDDLRRGKPTNHKIFGEAGAVLAGDALLSHAFEWMLSHAPEEPRALNCYVRAMRAVAAGAGAMGMVAGQSLELSGALDAGEVSLVEVHRLKTGALMRAAALAGGLAAGANDKELQALEAFAVHYGALFQITDDMLDASSEAQEGRNYVWAYGQAKAREMADAHAHRAAEALSTFGRHADVLKTLIARTRERANETSGLMRL